MGAVVPIVGAVVGTASAVSSISSQNKQAKAQREAIDAQAANSEANTALRLIEIEKQKLYAQSQTQIDNMARLNAREVQRAQNQLTQAQLDLQIQQAQLQQQTQSQIIGQNRDTQLQQLDVGDFTNQAQGQLTREAARNQFAVGEAKDVISTREGLQSSILSQNQALLDIEKQRSNSIVSANAQQIAAQEQATQILEGLATDFRQLERQQDRALDQQAAVAVQLAAQTGSPNSLSDQALLSANTNELSQDLVEATRQAGRTIGSVNNSLDMQSALREYLIKRANVTSGTQTAVANAQSVLQRESLFNNFSVNQTQRKQQLQQQLAGSNIQQTAQGQVNQIQRTGIQNQASQQQKLLDIQADAIVQTSQVDKNALEILKSAQANKFQLENEMSNLNNRFSDIALNSQKISAQVAGQSELNSLQAQRASITSPGALGTIGAITQGASAIYNGFLSGRS